MPLDPNDPMLQEAMSPYANPLLAQQLGAAGPLPGGQQSANPFQPAQPMLQNPNLLANNDTPNTPQAGDKLISDADAASFFAPKPIAGSATAPAAGAQPAADQGDQSLGALQ